MARDETPCLLIETISSHYPILVCCMAMSVSYNIYDHDKSALDETSYSLSLNCIVGLLFKSRSILKWGGISLVP